MSCSGIEFGASWSGDASIVNVYGIGNATNGIRVGTGVNTVDNSSAASFTAGIGAVVAGSGTLHVPVYCDGTNWRIG